MQTAISAILKDVHINKYGHKVVSHMSSMKCTSCGIGFFSPTGSDKCSRCAGKETPETQNQHDSCGCGHNHH